MTEISIDEIIKDYKTRYPKLSQRKLAGVILEHNDIGIKSRALRYRIAEWLDSPMEKSSALMNGSKRNILVVGDMHEPFCKKGYLEHCKAVYDTFKCNQVVFIGDIIDNHYSSYHETDPDGHSAGEELNRAVENLGAWHRTFPDADVVLGNHDIMPNRKTFTSGLSKIWMKSFADVLKTPTWKYHDEIEIDDVLYYHGVGSGGYGGARNRALQRGQSTIQGHTHTEASIMWHANKHKRYFGAYTGCGVDEKAYAMEYGKHYPRKMIVSCMVVLNNGKLPIVVPMEL